MVWKVEVPVDARQGCSLLFNDSTCVLESFRRVTVHQITSIAKCSPQAARLLKGLMFKCTLSILKPIHTEHFPKQTIAFQTDKCISFHYCSFSKKKSTCRDLLSDINKLSITVFCFLFLALSKFCYSCKRMQMRVKTLLSGAFRHLRDCRKKHSRIFQIKSTSLQ